VIDSATEVICQASFMVILWTASIVQPSAPASKPHQSLYETRANSPVDMGIHLTQVSSTAGNVAGFERR
jgi:hypothetical protein